jgi:DNA gyrase subunit B
MDKNQQKYDATTIQVLGGIEAVRKRPAMYIGDTAIYGLHHLVYEVLDNSIDESMGGFCNEIKITVHSDNSVTVADNGRGIPVDIHKTEKRPAVEVIMTVLHAGGKFDKKAYRVSGGLHGVGVSVVNALSEWLEVEVKRDGKVYHQRYERGKPVTPLTVVGKTKTNGTKVTFKPDEEVFESLDFDDNILCGRVRELAFLNAGVKIVFEDERKNQKEEYKFDGGLISFVEHLNKNKKMLFSPPLYFKKEEEEGEVEVAFQYNDGYSETVLSFANNVNTKEGGTHITGFRGGLTRAINEYAKNNGFINDKTLAGEDVREGLVAVVSVKLAEPQFEGQTKTKLGNSKIRFFVEGVTTQQVVIFLEENPEPAREIINKCIMTAKARDAAEEIIGIDSESFNINSADENCRLNNIKNCRFYHGYVEDVLKGPSFDGSDVVILDPPRAGLSGKALKNILRYDIPEIIYMSCNPAAFARDSGKLEKEGYSLARLYCADFFPHTTHLEVMGIFKKET